MKRFAHVVLSGCLCLTGLPAFAADIVVDNGGPGFTTVGAWTASTFDAGYHGTNYLHDGSAGADSGKYATWTPTIPSAGEYLVYMRWPAAANRPSAAPVEIRHAGGLDTSKAVNQQTGGGNWVLLGQYSLAAGTANYVRIHANASGYTIADAVRFEPTQAANVALNQPASASSTDGGNVAANAVDGVIDDSSRWLSTNTAGPHTLTVDLGASSTLICAHLHTGYGGGSAVANARLQSWNGSAWVDVPGASMSGNTAVDVQMLFTNPVTTSRMRLVASDSGYVRVKELKLFASALSGCPGLGSAPPAAGTPRTDILVNLSGYDIGKPKRFTAPLMADGTPFTIHRSGQAASVYTGTISGQVGDFSDFDPAESGDYLIQAGGKESYPFAIGPNWIERVSYQLALDFMIESRCYNSVSNTCITGLAWRDSHQFSFEVSTLVQMFMSNPSAYTRMPRKYAYAFNPSYQTLGAPAADAPDIVKMIHWGVDRILKVNNTATGNHPLLKGELAAFLYAWPQMKDWISQADYERVRDYTFNNWSHAGTGNVAWYELSPAPSGNMLSVYTVMGSGKGQFPPGHSVAPNLMLYAVALREGRSDAQLYFDAAYNQAQWMISNLDWNDPAATKGQRMSEHKTMEGLAFFQKMHPAQAPAGLLAKIEDWAAVAIARSSNMWDFRRYSATQWVIPDFNEPGNVLGFPAAALAAVQVLPDAATRQRLRQIAMAQVDNGFGRNPHGRHFSYDAPREVEGVEVGWSTYLNGGNGQLMAVHGVIDGAPKEAAYPFAPNAGAGYTEGWIAFNTAWNASLAYMAQDDTTIEVFNSGFSSRPSSLTYGSFGIELKAPLNFDYAAVESATVDLVSSNGDSERIVVSEKSASSFWFRNTFALANGARNDGDGVLQVPNGGWFEVSYGAGNFRKVVRYQASGSTFNRL
ncbi:discoidin domain-containing protein [Massilia sp. 9I]|uniref:golvesin C-terminal-like domain-containing protein n=1 Tax=Massilia sp. 9I TaxID=2653152 RepID=UPI0012F089FA|nr:discoidin domain-containing protein [Massilia sp. 9I]VXC62056.1 exported hypothetical protein [Massilia sp. 9I]